MTERIYYTDSSCFEFEAKITGCEKQADGCYHTRLDRSAFYPTSGGQSHDLGILNSIAIVDVIESGEDVVHVTKELVGEAGLVVAGSVDKSRRNQNRQLHSAQHLLSQVFYRLVDGVTMSVHLGEEYGAIEFDKATISAEMLTQAEAMINSMVRSCTPIEIIFAESTDIEKYGLRRPPKREGKIRIIRMGDLECTACGGTHCENTGEIQLVKIIGSEPIRKRTMVKFLAGAKALKDYQQRYNITSSLTRDLTCSVADLPERFEKITADKTSLRRELTAANKELLPIRAAKLIEAKLTFSNTNLIAANIPTDQLELGAQLAILAADKIEGLALLVCDDRIFIAASDNTKLQAGHLMRSLATKFGIRGGGSKQLAQGGNANPEELAKYQELITELVADAK